MGTYAMLTKMPDDFLQQVKALRDPTTGEPSQYATQAAAALEPRLRLRNEQQGAQSAGQGSPLSIAAQQDMAMQQGPQSAQIKQGVASLQQMQKQRSDAAAQQMQQAGSRRGPAPQGVPQPNPQARTGPMPMDMAGVSGLAPRNMYARGGIIGFDGTEGSSVDMTLADKDYQEELRRRKAEETYRQMLAAAEEAQRGQQGRMAARQIDNKRPMNTNQGNEGQHGLASVMSEAEMRRIQAAGGKAEPKKNLSAAQPLAPSAAAPRPATSAAPASSPGIAGLTEQARSRQMIDAADSMAQPKLLGQAQDVLDTRDKLRAGFNPYAAEQADMAAFIERKNALEQQQAAAQAKSLRDNGPLDFLGNQGTGRQMLLQGDRAYRGAVANQGVGAQNAALANDAAMVKMRSDMNRAKMAYDEGNFKAAEAILKENTALYGKLKETAMTQQAGRANTESTNDAAWKRWNTQSADSKGDNAAQIQAAKIRADDSGASGNPLVKARLAALTTAHKATTAEIAAIAKKNSLMTPAELAKLPEVQALRTKQQKLEQDMATVTSMGDTGVGITGTTPMDISSFKVKEKAK